MRPAGRPRYRLLTVRVAHRGPRADLRAGHAGRSGGLDPSGANSIAPVAFGGLFTVGVTWVTRFQGCLNSKINNLPSERQEPPETSGSLLGNSRKINDVQKRPTGTYATVRRSRWTFLNVRGQICCFSPNSNELSTFSTMRRPETSVRDVRNSKAILKSRNVHCVRRATVKEPVCIGWSRRRGVVV